MVARYPVIGITGGVGCGKSEVGRILAGIGVPVLDADDVAHALLEPGSPVVEQVVQRFGRAYVRPEGGVDRPALARLVFADAQARRDLEGLVHPPVWLRIQQWIRDHRDRGPVAVLVPLLYEADLTAGWSAIWCVSAPPGVVRERCRARGWSEDEVLTRQAAQWPLREKEKRADVVVSNHGSRDELVRTVRQAWSMELKRSA